MSSALFRYSWKRSFPLWFFCTALLCLYSFIVIRSYDPHNASMLPELMSALPQSMAILGAGELSDSFTAFVVTDLYGLLLAVPILFTVMLSSRLVAQQISRGTMTYLLTTSNSRTRILSSQRGVLLFDLFLMMTVVCGATIAISYVYHPNELEIIPFAMICLGIFALQLTFAGLCFLVSTICNHAGSALTLSAVLCLLFYLIRLLSRLGGVFGYFAYLTPYTLLNPAGLLQLDAPAIAVLLVFVVLAAILFFIADRHFRKKNLML